jgi:prolyl 4-hydroxylase
MKGHKINSKLDNFIKGWYIDKKICDDLITFFKKNKKNQRPGHIAGGIKPKIKKSTDITFPINHEDQAVKNYTYALDECTEEYIKLYKPLNEIMSRWKVIEPVNIQKYKKKEAFFKWHSERLKLHLCNRLLVFMTYLNDVTEGGETEWFYQKTKIKAEKGLTVIWPVDFTYLHRGCVSKTQEKYIITGWYSFCE